MRQDGVVGIFRHEQYTSRLLVSSFGGLADRILNGGFWYDIVLFNLVSTDTHAAAVVISARFKGVSSFLVVLLPGIGPKGVRCDMVGVVFSGRVGDAYPNFGGDLGDL